MNKRDLEKFKKLLLEEGKHLQDEIRIIGKDTQEGRLSESTGDITSFAEAGTDNNDRETALRVASGESQMLDAVAEALERIKDGSYGVCVDCGKDIPRKRLEVFPSAKRCVACKEILEKSESG